jgi:hypothetical protein
MNQKIIFLEKKIKLELLLHDVIQLSADDSGLQGTNDEVFASEGRAYRSDNLFVNNQQVIQAKEEIIHIPSIENRDLAAPYDSANDIDVRPNFPILIHQYDLQDTNAQNILFSANLFVVEHDNGDLGSTFKQYGEKFTTEAGKAVVAGGKEVLGAAGGVIAGPVGAFIGREILGRGLEYLVTEGLARMWDGIVDGLNDESLDPFMFAIKLDGTNFNNGYGTQPIISNGINTLDYHSKGAHYQVLHEWKLYREVMSYRFNFQHIDTILNQYKANEHQLEVGNINRCAHGGFIANIWTDNYDNQYNFQVGCDKGVDNFEWRIDGVLLIADGMNHIISIRKNVNRTELFNSENVNVLIEYSCSNFSDLKIVTKGEFGNYLLNVTLSCMGKLILSEDLYVHGQDFLGDKRYTDYVNCIGREMHNKAKLLKIYTLKDFKPKGPIAIEVFGKISSELEMVKAELLHRKNILRFDAWKDIGSDYPYGYLPA